MIIKNTTLFGGEICDIKIEDGKIAELGQNLSGGEIIDASGLTAFPGFIDMHVHMRYPGQTHKEDPESMSRAAAAGGVTGVLVMPNTTPTVDNPETLGEVLSAKGCTINIYSAASVSKGLKGEQMTDFELLAQNGATAFSDDGRPVYSSAMMLDAMKAAKQLGRPVLSHAEELSLAVGIMFEGETSRKLNVAGTPAAAEAVAVARDVALARCYDLPIHICHVSTKQSLDIIREAKADGVPVTCETAPHYFTFNEQSLICRSARFRMNPPLALESDRLAVIDAIVDGTIDAIVTDHAPHSIEEKSDFEKAPNGVVGLETSFAASYTKLVKTGVISLEKLVELMCYRPAEILGVECSKLRARDRADIALIDLNEKWTVDPEQFFTKGRSTPFEGEALFGRVKRTICGGRVVF